MNVRFYCFKWPMYLWVWGILQPSKMGTPEKSEISEMCPWFCIIDLILQETHKIFILFYITLKFQQLTKQWYQSLLTIFVYFKTLPN